MDVGCNADFYSFELAARQFGLASRIEFRCMQFYDLAREPHQHDLVWFMGVLYHLRHPLLALDILRRRTRRLLMLQTLTMPGDATLEPPPDFPIDERGRLLADGWPRMAFIEERMSGDPTNWWAPNDACVQAMLRSVGFRIRARVAHETYVCEPAPDGVWSAMIDQELRAATGTKQ